MTTFTIILSLLSGVALFLLCMSLGTAVTAIIQSSSATTVMVVGFVNSGMMKVAQAIGIIMGANIGTRVTVWILCLSYIDGSNGIAQLLSTATISAIVAIIGIIFKMFVKKSGFKNVGDIMLGFSILMVGMQTMSGAVAPLKDNEHFVNVLPLTMQPFAEHVTESIRPAHRNSPLSGNSFLQGVNDVFHLSTAIRLSGQSRCTKQYT